MSHASAVTETSAAVYRRERPRFDAREHDVLSWLESFSAVVAPTSGELAVAVKHFDAVKDMDPTELRLFVRRGLSGLKALGKVRNLERRRCTVTHRICETWVTT